MPLNDGRHKTKSTKSKPFFSHFGLALLLGASAFATVSCSTAVEYASEAVAIPPAETTVADDAEDTGTTEAVHPNEPTSGEGYIPELGPFDRSNPDFLQFVPCLELPEDLFKSAGFVKGEPITDLTIEHSTCRFRGEPLLGEANFYLRSGQYGFEGWEKVDGKSSWTETSNGDKILLHNDTMFPEGNCWAITETKRGTLELALISSPIEVISEGLDYCKEVQSKILELLAADGKHQF